MPLWDARMVTLLKKGVRDGLSCSQIALEISEAVGVRVTRNAVIGKMWRGPPELLNEFRTIWRMTRAKYTRPMKVLQSRPKRARVQLLVPPKAFMPIEETVPIVPEAAVPAIVNGIPIYQLESDTCRWPLWGDSTLHEGRLYCGQHTEGTYCPTHYALSIREPARSLITRKLASKG